MVTLIRAGGQCNSTTMNMLKRLVSKLTRTKTLEDVANSKAADLHRCLTTLDLTLMGIGSMVGSGIYILVGIAARELAGPAIVLSFLFAGMTIFLGAVCLTEFAARVPRTGSTYLYTYFTLGELLAFLIGWSTVVASILGGATNARAWSAYLDSLFDGAIVNATETYIGKFNLGAPMAARPDFVAVLVMLLVTGIVATGANCSSRVTSLFAVLNISVLILVIVLGFVYADTNNWTSKEHGGFMPYGFTGVLSGSTACYWAFTGYEVIAVSVEEAKNPQKSVVRAVALALSAVTLLYVCTACALTLVTSYTEIDPEAPLPSAFAARGITWARYALSIGPLCGITTTLLTSQYAMVRILYAMSSDGLFFQMFGRINKATGIPLPSVLLGGILMAAFGFCLDLRDIISFAVVLNLAQYVLVSAGVIILRYQAPKEDYQNLSRSESLATSIDQGSEDDYRYSQISDLEDNPRPETKHEFEKVSLEADLYIPPNHKGLTIRPFFHCLESLIRCSIHRWITAIVLALFCLIVIAVVLGIHMRHSLLSGEPWIIIIISLLTLTICLLLLCVAVYKQNTAGLYIKVPCVPVVPILSMTTSIMLLASNATVSAWVGTAIVFLLGLIIYFSYGIRHSKENVSHTEMEMSHSTVSLLRPDMDGEESDEI